MRDTKKPKKWQESARFEFRDICERINDIGRDA